MKKFFLFIFVCISFFLNGQVIRSSNSQNLHVSWKLLQNQSRPDAGFVCALVIHNDGDASVPPSGWKIFFNLRYHGYHLRSLNDMFKIAHVSGDLFYIEPTVSFKGLRRNESIEIEYVGTGTIANFQDVPSGIYWVDNKHPDIAKPLKEMATNQPDENILFPDSAAQKEREMGYHENESIQKIPLNQLPKIFPTPVGCKIIKKSFLMNANTVIVAERDFDAEAAYLNTEIKKLIGKKLTTTNASRLENVILLQKSPLPEEAYRLTVHPNFIRIEASGGAGAFYGIQSLKSLLPIEYFRKNHPQIRIPCVEVIDSPRFSVRAFMLDVSRNFQPKNEILRVLDLMASYKMNVLHFHLTDDEGWRIEIPGLKELTTVGSKRGYPFRSGLRLHPSYGSGPEESNASGSGFYSRTDFIEILKFATQRHILVIPEIESPGHARAAVKAMHFRYEKLMKLGEVDEAGRYLLDEPGDSSSYMSAQYFNDNVMNVAMPSVYRFMEKVFDEIASMYRDAKAPLTTIHVGGDEVPVGSWEKSQAVAVWFQKHPSFKTIKELWRDYFHQLESMLARHGIFMSGWQELATGVQRDDGVQQMMIDSDFISHQVRLDAWWNIAGNEDIAYKFANEGYKVVVSFVDYLYFDLAYARNFSDPGDGWIGYLDLKKVFSLCPENYFVTTTDITGKSLPKGYFAHKQELSEAGKKNIIGIQAAMWAENLRNKNLLEHLLLPRLLAVAERAWTKRPAWSVQINDPNSSEEFKKEWSVFVNEIAEKELPKLDFIHNGYAYRIPTAATRISNGLVWANCEFPGYTLRYTVNGGEPSSGSKKYSGPLAVKGTIRFRVFDKRNRGGNPIAVLNR